MYLTFIHRYLGETGSAGWEGGREVERETERDHTHTQFLNFFIQIHVQAAVLYKDKLKCKK